MAEIQLKGISKRWGSFIGVDDFNLTIADKEFLVLLGPSGCGKTTTMRMIAGLEDASDGDVFIDGKRVNDLDPKDRDVASQRTGVRCEHCSHSCEHCSHPCVHSSKFTVQTRNSIFYTV